MSIFSPTHSVLHDNRSFGPGLKALKLVLLAMGFCMAGFLTWFMYALIQSGDERLNESERIHFADFIQARQPEVTRRKERAPQRPEISEAPPTPQAAQANDALEGEVVAISDIQVDTQVTAETGLDFGSGDGEYLPIIKLAPVYPMAAKARRIEGTCLVAYTVTTTGSVKDVTVLENQCSHESFHQPSINAALKFKYKPRVIDGAPVEVHGVKNRFIYKLDREGGQ